MTIGTDLRQFSLQRYSRLNALTLASQLVNLVQANQEWLDVVRPGVSEGYRDFKTAVKRIGRIAASKELNAYAVKTGAAVVGVATAIRNQTVDVPARHGTVDNDRLDFTGTDIDYWLDNQGVDAVGDWGHAEMVRRLISEEGISPADRVFAALKPEEESRAPGMQMVLKKFYDPTSIDAPYGDPYNITKSGAVLQLYVNM